MSADVRHARLSAAPLFLVLAAAALSPATAQAQTPVAARARTATPVAREAVPLRAAARDAAADLRFEAIAPLPDTLTLADLSLGVPLLVQTVTRGGRPVDAAISWRIVSGEAVSISADRRTDGGGYAAATFGRELGELPRPGHVVIEARTRPHGADRDLTVRLSTVLVRR